jgi:hypothetical protein
MEYFDDPSVIDIIDLSFVYQQGSSFGGALTDFDEDILVVIRSSSGGIEASIVPTYSDLTSTLRSCLRWGAKAATTGSWSFSSPQDAVGEHIDYHLTPYSQRSFFSFGKPSYTGFLAARLITEMGWLRGGFDAVFEKVAGTVSQYRFSRFQGSGAVGKAPWVALRCENIRVKYWSLKNATIRLACEFHYLPSDISELADEYTILERTLEPRVFGVTEFEPLCFVVVLRRSVGRPPIGVCLPPVSVLTISVFF